MIIIEKILVDSVDPHNQMLCNSNELSEWLFESYWMDFVTNNPFYQIEEYSEERTKTCFKPPSSIKRRKFDPVFSAIVAIQEWRVLRIDVLVIFSLHKRIDWDPIKINQSIKSIE